MWVYKHFSGEFTFISGLLIVNSIWYEAQTELYEISEVIFIYIFLFIFSLWFASNGVGFFLLLVVHDVHTCKQNLSYF